MTSGRQLGLPRELLDSSPGDKPWSDLVKGFRLRDAPFTTGPASQLCDLVARQSPGSVPGRPKLFRNDVPDKRQSHLHPALLGSSLGAILASSKLAKSFCDFAGNPAK